MGNKDNPKIGAKFEEEARNHFSGRGLNLSRGYRINIGLGDEKKPHSFDLGSDDPPIIVECKRHKWTSGGNAPSAKLSVWNEAILYFLAAPNEYRKILFVLKSLRNGQSLAEHYFSRYSHMVPDGVEIWEYDIETEKVTKIK